MALCSIALLLGAIVGFATMGLDRVFCPQNAANLDQFTRVGSQSGTLSVEGVVVNISQSLTGAVNFYSLATQSSGQDITNLFKRDSSYFPECKGLSFAAATDDPCAASETCQLGAPTPATLDQYKITRTGKLSGYDWDQIVDLSPYLVIDGHVLNLTPYIELHPNPINNDPVDAALRQILVGQSPKYGKDATRLFTQRSNLKSAIPCLTQRYTAGQIDKISPGCFTSALFLYASLVVILGLVLVRFAMACIFNWFLSARLVQPPKNLSRTVISPAVMPEGANVAVDNKNGTAPWAGGGAPVTIGGKKLHKGNVYQKASTTSPNTSSTTLVPSPSSISPNSAKAPQQPLITMAQIGAELFCVCLVTCYSEGEDSLRTTCDSISTTTYSDSRKLLFIVADGIITGEGEKRSTPDICVSLLEQDPRFGSPIPMGYVAVGTGAKQENKALVYAGHYSEHRSLIYLFLALNFFPACAAVAGRRTPTIVVVKCGTEAEQRKEKKPGNRGKRDSQLILMNFFSRVTYNDRMTPLDFDMFRKVQVLMGVTPDFFEVTLMVRAVITAFHFLIASLPAIPRRSTPTRRYIRIRSRIW